MTHHLIKDIDWMSNWSFHLFIFCLLVYLFVGWFLIITVASWPYLEANPSRIFFESIPKKSYYVVSLD